MQETELERGLQLLVMTTSKYDHGNYGCSRVQDKIYKNGAQGIETQGGRIFYKDTEFAKLRK